MKKNYINPNIEIIDIDMKSAMLTSTSSLSVGSDMSSGDAAGRNNDGDDW